MPESIIFPPRSVSRFLTALSWVPMVQWGDISTSLLWRWDNWISSISSAGSLFPDFSPHSTSAVFSLRLLFVLHSLIFWGHRFPGWGHYLGHKLPRAERTKCSLAPECPLLPADPSLQPHVSCSPFAVPLTFSWISRHLSELLSSPPCSSDTCQEHTGPHCWVEGSLSLEHL